MPPQRASSSSPMSRHRRTCELWRRSSPLSAWRARASPPSGEREPSEVVLVDRVGVLAELYADADAAYVGGAFGRGVHNVIEPAIMELPLFFGPGHHNAPEAEMLLENGAAAVIRSPVDLERQLQRVAGDTAERLRRGGRARAFVAANLGASERCLQRLLQALEARPTPVREPG